MPALPPPNVSLPTASNPAILSVTRQATKLTMPLNDADKDLIGDRRGNPNGTRFISTLRLIQNPLRDQLLGAPTCTDTPRNLD